MLAGLVDLAMARHHKYRVVPVDQFPSLYDLTESTMIGSFSWLGLQSKTRFIHRPTAVNVGGYLVTPSDVARDYLSLKFGKWRRRVTTSQYHAIMEKRHHPLFAKAGKYPDAAYIDIKAAYWSILKIIGWDVDYNPGRWFGQGESMDDFPYAGHKLARNCLVSAGLLGRQKIWSYKRQRLVSVKRGNGLTNYSLWACVQDTLNAIAEDCIEQGAVYCHTDGFIVRRSDMVNVMAAIARWGLVSGVKYEGPAEVFSAGCYSIGSKVNRRVVYATRTMRSITNLVSRDWLRGRFRKFAMQER